MIGLDFITFIYNPKILWGGQDESKKKYYTGPFQNCNILDPITKSSQKYIIAETALEERILEWIFEGRRKA